MANILDYLDWRGDLSMAEAPFNEVDNLILCELSYIPFDGILPGPENPQQRMPLFEAAQRYFEGREGESIHMGVLVPDTIPLLFERMALTRRYRELLLSSYVNRIDPDTAKQFSAMTIDLGTGAKFIAYRGTDDTLVGWKENFHMSFLPSVPAQRDALAYLCQMAEACPAEQLIVGGHSKGGNLAVYAAMHSPEQVQQRILAVYNNDGPGLQSSALQFEGYLRIRERVHTLLPQSSVVGLLLEHEEEFQVVQSNSIGPFQHDGFSWNVLGPRFIRRSDLSNASKRLDRTLKNWLLEMDSEKRQQLVDTLFTVLEATEAQTLTDLGHEKLKNAAAMLRTFKALTPETKRMLFLTLKALMKESMRFTDRRHLPEHKE